MDPEVRRSASGVLPTTLRVGYAYKDIGSYRLSLRRYEGDIPGPTFCVRPGDTLRIKLINALPPNPDAVPVDQMLPHHFNTTNLHFHGGHLDPGGISGNGAIFSARQRASSSKEPFGASWFTMSEPRVRAHYDQLWHVPELADTASFDPPRVDLRVVADASGFAPQVARTGRSATNRATQAGQWVGLVPDQIAANVQSRPVVVSPQRYPARSL